MEKITRSVTLHLGDAAINHNRRVEHWKSKSGNIHEELSKNNEVLFERFGGDLKKLYDVLFSESVAEYNKKERHKERRIDDYYKKMVEEYQRGKKDRKPTAKRPVYEMWIQIGNMETTGINHSEREKEVLRDYVKHFEERNKNLVVIGAYLHNDEATSHVHLDFVPVSTQNTRGMRRQVSITGALREMGYTGDGTRKGNPLKDFTAREREILGKVCRAHNIEVLKDASDGHDHMSTRSYIKYKQKLKELEQEKQRAAESVKRAEAEAARRVQQAEAQAAQRVQQAERNAQAKAAQVVSDYQKKARAEMQRIDNLVYQHQALLNELTFLGKALSAARVYDEESLEKAGITKNKKGKYELDYNVLRSILDVSSKEQKTRKALNRINEMCKYFKDTDAQLKESELKKSELEEALFNSRQELDVEKGSREEVERAFQKLCKDIVREPYNFLEIYDDYLKQARQDRINELNQGARGL